MRTTQIRLAEPADAAAIAAIYGPMVESTPISFETVPPTPDEMAKRIADKMPAHAWLVCDIDGLVAGYAYSGKFADRAAYRWSVQTSVYIHAKHRRQGVGRGLYASLFAILVRQGYVNAYAGITLPNPSSVGLHEALGFRRVGVYERVGYKFAAWYDVGWWQLTLRPYAEAPAEPVDVPTLGAHKDWSELVGAGEKYVD